MTQQQIIQEFKTLSRIQKSAIIRQLLHILEQDLEDVKEEISVETKLDIVERLSGIAAVEGKAAPTDKEVKEDYIKYISEKYK